MTIMDKTTPSKLDLPTHGAATLPSVTVDSYNIEVRDEDGFIGDKASKGAFWEIVEKWRNALRKAGGDPFGKTTTEELTKKQLVNELEKGDPEAAGVVQSAVEEFSQQFAEVIRRFLRTKEWRRYGSYRHRRRLSRKPAWRAGGGPYWADSQGR